MARVREGTDARLVVNEFGDILSERQIEKSVAADVRDIFTHKAHSMHQAVQSTLRIVRRILCALRPPLLDELGLNEAMEWHMEDFSKRTGIRYDKDATAVASLPPSFANAVFRSFQKILTNAGRHSKASRIRVSLRDVANEILLTVENNGVGFAADKLFSRTNFGLLGMRERALSVGGKVDVSGAPGRGASVILRVPVPPVDEQAGVLGAQRPRE